MAHHTTAADHAGGPRTDVSARSGPRTRPTVARIWRGRVRADRADEYEAYSMEAGIRPLFNAALGVQALREDRGDEVEFVVISYWEDVAAMSRFAGDDPRRVHHLDRDPEFLVELPVGVQVLHIRAAWRHAAGRRDVLLNSNRTDHRSTR
jgi:hypothetical protein